jgi:hypothetical protein
MPCVGLLTAGEILAEAAGLAIRETGDEALPVYVQALGAGYAVLPAPVARLHDLAAPAVWQGRADVGDAGGPVARLLARLFGFPPAQRDVPVTVAFDVRDGIETWRRTFGGHAFLSLQYAGTGTEHGLIVERFGPVAFAMRVVPSAAGIDLELRSGRVFGIGLPRALWPRISAAERVDAEGRFQFDVTIGVPLAGRLVRYRGWLQPVDPISAPAAG